jgi:hypothetical protein
VACSVPLRPDADIGLVQEGELDSQWSTVPGLYRLFLKPAWSAKPVSQKKKGLAKCGNCEKGGPRESITSRMCIEMKV